MGMMDRGCLILILLSLPIFIFIVWLIAMIFKSFGEILLFYKLICGIIITVVIIVLHNIIGGNW